MTLGAGGDGRSSLPPVWRLAELAVGSCGGAAAVGTRRVEGGSPAAPPQRGGLDGRFRPRPGLRRPARRRDLQNDDCPPEVQTLGRTLVRWGSQIVAWHRAQVTNGPPRPWTTSSSGSSGYGFRPFAHYRIRVLLYAGKPDCDLLAAVHPAEIR